MKAYSLIELLIVVSIIGLMAVFGIPSYQRYGKVSQFQDKTNQIKSLVQQMYYLSKNPEDRSIESYVLKNVDAAPLSNEPEKLVIKKLPADEEVASVSFTEVELIGDVEITCSTQASTECTVRAGTPTPVTFSYQNTAIQRSSNYSIVLTPTISVQVQN